MALADDCDLVWWRSRWVAGSRADGTARPGPGWGQLFGRARWGCRGFSGPARVLPAVLSEALICCQRKAKSDYSSWRNGKATTIRLMFRRPWLCGRGRVSVIEPVGSSGRGRRG
jgi:hypothetical protein